MSLGLGVHWANRRHAERLKVVPMPEPTQNLIALPESRESQKQRYCSEEALIIKRTVPMFKKVESWSDWSI